VCVYVSLSVYVCVVCMYVCIICMSLCVCMYVCDVCDVESQGRGSLVGCHLWGRTESDTTEVT